METKKSSQEMGILSRRFGFAGGVSVSAIGAAGGLALWWRGGWNINILFMDGNRIIAKVGADRNGVAWVGAFVYAPPRRDVRDAFWGDFSSQMNDVRDPWMLIGDLNSVLLQSDKVGGNPVTCSEGRGLRNFIFDTGAVNVEGAGAFFTWSNGQKWQNLIREKLDRVYASSEWILLFKKAGVKNFAVRHSDHSAIVLDTLRDRERICIPFRYFDAWSRDDSCAKIIAEAWAKVVCGYHSFILSRKLSFTASALRRWSVEHFGSCKAKMEMLEKFASIVARSIWSAKQLVLANSAWRVGSESDVNLWSGRWIIGDDVLICAGDINPTVKPRIVLGDLLQADSLAWDIRGVEDIFRPSVAAVMVRLNPLDLPLEDELVWTLTPKGNFTLKSVYWALNANSLCSGNGIFKKIWYGTLHPRLQLFVWKLYADALPTGSRLGAIFGNEPGSCALCDCPSGNTTSHLFWECEVAKRLWFISKWNVRIDSVNINFGRDLVEWIFNAPFSVSFNNSEKEEFICFAVCLCYSLWRFRNEAFHSKKVLPFENMHKQVEREFAMFSLKPCKHKPPNTPSQDVGFTREIHSGQYQVWVDAAFHAGGAAIGVIIKNPFNQLQALFACKVEAHSVIAGELQAVIKGFEALQLLGVDRGCFFTDCQTLTVAAKEKRPPSWSTACSFSKLLRAIEGMGVFLVWIPRSENSGAHTLAKWATLNDCNGFVNFWDINPSISSIELTPSLKFLIQSSTESSVASGGVEIPSAGLTTLCRFFDTGSSSQSMGRSAGSLWQLAMASTFLSSQPLKWHSEYLTTLRVLVRSLGRISSNPLPILLGRHLQRFYFPHRPSFHWSLTEPGVVDNRKLIDELELSTSLQNNPCQGHEVEACRTERPKSFLPAPTVQGQIREKEGMGETHNTSIVASSASVKLQANNFFFF
ncbi:hypothetical protein G4B88_020611 [Cannabis sativa]|uniref:RNase H type-1 domain-containing protein n=1 Tax=Cannabis sativa TaxID=3483 RepID=A0A7J6EKT9_CANSA|nr:hypothetical protein G4B88_020611 [Cannabis sativa]